LSIAVAVLVVVVVPAVVVIDDIVLVSLVWQPNQYGLEFQIMLESDRCNYFRWVGGGFRCDNTNVFPEDNSYIVY